MARQKETVKLINCMTNNWSEIGPKSEKQFRLQWVYEFFLQTSLLSLHSINLYIYMQVVFRINIFIVVYIKYFYFATPKFYNILSLGEMDILFSQYLPQCRYQGPCWTDSEPNDPTSNIRWSKGTTFDSYLTNLFFYLWSWNLY